MKSWLVSTILALLCYGLWGFLPKLATQHLDPKNVIIYQGVGTALMTLVIPFLPGFKWQGYQPASFFSLLTGLVAVIGNLFLVMALSKGKASVVIPLTASYPIITLLLATIFLRETVSIRQKIGIAMALIAALLLGT